MHCTLWALRSVAWALAGAVVGGLLAFGWGAWSIESANRVMAGLPAIDHAMITAVSSDVADDGPRALVSAPLQGRPYKLYAAATGGLGGSPVALALWTVPGRAWRFVGLTLLFGALEDLRRRYLARIPQWPFFAGWGFFWLVVYARFWSA